MEPEPCGLMKGASAALADQPVVGVEALSLALLTASPELPVVEDVAGDEPEQVPLVHGLLLPGLLPFHCGEVVIHGAGQEGGLRSVHGGGRRLTDCSIAYSVTPKLVNSIVWLTPLFHLVFIGDKGKTIKLI